MGSKCWGFHHRLEKRRVVARLDQQLSATTVAKTTRHQKQDKAQSLACECPCVNPAWRISAQLYKKGSQDHELATISFGARDEDNGDPAMIVS